MQKKEKKKIKKSKNTIVAYFQAKIGWKMLRERKQKLSFRFVPTRRVRENSKKIAKNYNKLKYTVVASFQAKIGGERPRKRKNKNCLSVPFLPDR